MKIIILLTLIPCLLIIILIIFVFAFYKTQKKYYLNIETGIKNKVFSNTITTLKWLDTTLLKKEELKKEELLKNNSNLTNEDMLTIIENNLELIQIKNDKENFASRLNKVEKELRNIRILHNIGCSQLSKKKLINSYFIIKKIKNSLNVLNQIKIATEKESRQYTIDFEILNKELWLYRNIFKNDIITIVESWKINEKVSINFIKKIDQKVIDINLINNEIESLIENQDYKNAKMLVEKYKKSMYEILYFGNYFDKFVQELFENANKKFVKLKNFYNLTKITFNSNLKYLEFDLYFQNSKNKWKQAIQSFEKLDVKNTKELIGSFEKDLINITLTLNNEIKSNNFLCSSKSKEIFLWFEDTMAKNIKIQKQIEDVINLDSVYFDWLKFEKKKMENLLLELNKIKEKIINEQNKDISRVSKQYKYKSFMYVIKSFNESYFNIKKEINIFYSEGLSPRLKFNKTKNVILKMESFIKTSSLKLSKEDLNIIKINELKRNKIDKNITMKNINEESLIHQIKEYEKKSIEYLLTIGKKVVIANMYKKLNESYSYKRIKNMNLHKAFLYTEKIFMDGEYENSLLLLINAIEKEFI